MDTRDTRRKHRPMEISSKKPVGRFRQIIEIPSHIKKRRDPRFDDLSGKFNEDLFEKSYSFLNEYKRSEIEEVKKSISKERDPEEKQKLQQLLNKLKLELVDKFKKLQKSDSKVLDRVIEKRRKKNASKEHKYVPFKRRRKVDL
ncbi:23121_t:CDS:2 [Dentiscutata erythropus]|uniref:rRNA biogenesis protein RRP36 n=1 Tax=Dentiscutata erythropus TaxID=1348616 RepID=A0A9N8ZZP7_9GLOM|nr:23121_t:CDS:2 [Dentiscutata erythropus]